MNNVLITGATRGIGRATALAFAKQGFNIAACSRNNVELDQLKSDLLNINPEISFFAAAINIGLKTDVLNFAHQAEQALGVINVIVNNAGLYQPSTILNDNDNALDQALAVNLMPAYELYRYFGKKMIAERKGHIFNICSSASINPVVEAGTYSVTKFALLGLTKVMRLETQEYGVKVTAVIPGSTLTSSWQGTTVPTERFIQPDDLASAIVTAFNMSAGANTDEIIINPAFGKI